MRSSALFTAVAAITLLTGCDNITGLDNRDPPTSPLTGRVVYQGQPVGVRNNEVQLELWEPAYFERYGQLTKIPINVAQDGSFSALLFDGDYKLNLLANNGPWVSTTDTLLVDVNGSATVDFPVTPYYTIQNPTFTRGAPTTAAPGGTVSTTFKVGQINTTRQLEFVGLYIGLTSWVDATNSIPTSQISNAQRQRTRAQILPQLNANGDITITVTLPANVYESNSPWRRDVVFARVGVKTVGVNQMLFSQVFEVAI